ncbi:hypothetical protein PVAP13_1NG442838 [Panicum virgatum]|uniref:Uncharacterized protein n=1 Tax=Panicum virgatum TaxID=38727 RepID=A0A8T0X3Q1_PANVG|nr:hypothetical protein PVAP13_1NG442838 [Panicum virgatum]
MLIFVAGCYLCCLPSISVDASLAPNKLKSFTREKWRLGTVHTEGRRIVWEKGR